MTNRDWMKEFPLSTIPVYPDEVYELRQWALKNIGPQDDRWCIVFTVYGGDKQFRFKYDEDLVLFKLAWG